MILNANGATIIDINRAKARGANWSCMTYRGPACEKSASVCSGYAGRGGLVCINEVRCAHNKRRELGEGESEESFKAYMLRREGRVRFLGFSFAAGREPSRAKTDNERQAQGAVSYTHLTLPTIA